MSFPKHPYLNPPNCQWSNSHDIHRRIKAQAGIKSTTRHFGLSPGYHQASSVITRHLVLSPGSHQASWVITWVQGLFQERMRGGRECRVSQKEKPEGWLQDFRQADPGAWQLWELEKGGKWFPQGALWTDSMTLAQGWFPQGALWTHSMTLAQGGPESACDTIIT